MADFLLFLHLISLLDEESLATDVVYPKLKNSENCPKKHLTIEISYSIYIRVMIRGI